MSAAEYQRNADMCASIAETTSDLQVKASMTAMATAWLRLATQAEKNQELDGVYEVRSAVGGETRAQTMQQQPPKANGT